MWYQHVTSFVTILSKLCTVYLRVTSCPTDTVNRAQLVLNPKHSFNIYAKKNSVTVLETKIHIDFQRGDCKEQIKGVIVKNLI